MSWLEKVENDLVIFTGDGTEFRPKWVNAQLQQEYNIAEFNFPELEGTLVKRSARLGIRFAMEICFDGADHLETSEQFREAAKDTNYWVMEHPLYGVFPCQPTALNFDNTGFNVSKITCTLIETIIEDEPLVYGPEFNLPEQIQAQKDLVDAAVLTSVTYDLLPADVNTLRETNNRNFKMSVPIIKLPAEFELYNNLFNEANNLISTAIASPLLAIRAVNSAISQPSRFTAAVSTRVNLLVNEFDRLRMNIENLTSISGKGIYEIQGSSMIGAACIAASTPQPNNYTNSGNVLQIIDLIYQMFQDFLADLDLLQSINGGTTSSFIPNAGLMFNLSNLVYTTLAGLFSIALSSKKERSLILEEDTNIIMLTHRVYGLDNADLNIDELIANNNFGLNQMLVIEKNTKVIYYT